MLLRQAVKKARAEFSQRDVREFVPRSLATTWWLCLNFERTGCRSDADEVWEYAPVSGKAYHRQMYTTTPAHQAGSYINHVKPKDVVEDPSKNLRNF